MPRSLQVHRDHRHTLDQALIDRGFFTQGRLAGHLGLATCTVSNFFRSQKIYISNFERICEALGLEMEEITKSRSDLGVAGKVDRGG